MLKPIFGIFAVVGWVVLIGLHVVWRYTFGWLFTTLAGLIDVGIPIPHFGDPHPFAGVARWLRSLDRNVDASLVRAANGLEHSAVWLLSRVGHFFGRIASTVAALALAVEHKIDRLARVTIPRLVRDLLKGTWRELRSLGKYARRLIPELRSTLLALARFAKRSIIASLKQLGFLLQLVRHHWRFLSRSLLGAWKLLRRLERRFVPKGFARGVGVALGHLGLGFLFSSNFGRLAKWVLTLDYGAVLDWVRDELAPLAPSDLCELGELTYDAAVFVFEPIMQEIVGLENRICPSSRGHLPSAVTYPAQYAGGWTPSETPTLAGAFERLVPGSPLPAGVKV